MRILKYISIITLFLLFSCKTNDFPPKIVLDDLPEDSMEFQKMVIGQLTGEKAIQTADDGAFSINSRWSYKEKILVLEYLRSVIRALDFTPLAHSYAIPNQNFGVDLLVEPLKGRNLYSILPSTSPSTEYVILGAHYDTGGKNVPGAIDNGSGIALILRVLQQIKDLEQRNRNVLIVFFDQEEEGISAGSIALAKYLLANKYDIHSVHTFDLIGWDGDGNKEVELALPKPEIEMLYKKHASVLNIPIYVSKVTSTDHYSFIKQGINASCLSQAFAKGDNSGKKDTPEDKYHLVNFEYLNSSTNLAFNVVKEILYE